MTELFWAKVPDDLECPELCRLSTYRMDKLSRIRTPGAYRASLGAELLLVKALRMQQGEVELPLKICCDEYGKPYFKDNLLFFNLSHSGKYVACALSDEPVGVDIQILRPCCKELIKRYFSAAEQDHIEKSTDQERAFTRIWARKESLLKAVGLGLRLPLAEVDVSSTDAFVTFRTKEYSFFEQEFSEGQLCLCRPNTETCAINCVQLELP